MDSMDRSLLDCDLFFDQPSSSGQPLDRPFLSLDPGQLVGLGPGSEAGCSIRSSSRNLPDGGSRVGGKAEEAVAKVCSDSGDFGGGRRSETPRRETVVKFEASVPSTSLVADTIRMESKSSLGVASSTQGERRYICVQQVPPCNLTFLLVI